MPVLVNDPARLARLKRAQENVEFFQHHLDDLRAMKVRYVVVSRSAVVGTGATEEEAWANAGSEVRARGAVVLHVPQENETYLF